MTQFSEAVNAVVMQLRSRAAQVRRDNRKVAQKQQVTMQAPLQGSNW